MNSKEILTSIKELVGLSKEEEANEVEATEEVNFIYRRSC